MDGIPVFAKPDPAHGGYPSVPPRPVGRTALLEAAKTVVALDPAVLFPMRPAHVTADEWRRWCQAMVVLENAVSSV